MSDIIIGVVTWIPVRTNQDIYCCSNLEGNWRLPTPKKSSDKWFIAKTANILAPHTTFRERSMCDSWLDHAFVDKSECQNLLHQNQKIMKNNQLRAAPTPDTVLAFGFSSSSLCSGTNSLKKAPRLSTTFLIMKTSAFFSQINLCCKKAQWPP